MLFRVGDDELRITRVTPEWCTAETGGVVILLFLTSIRTAWVPHIADAIRGAASRHEHGRAALMAVFRLDRRYPLDIGFDRNLGELREGIREVVPSIGATAIVLEFGGVLTFTMKTAMSTFSFLARTKHPRTFHSTVVSAASWLLPHASADRRRAIPEYVGAVNRMKADLGCEVPPSSPKLQAQR
jgi:hypothetical protein